MKKIEIELMVVAGLLVSASSFATECYSNADCSVGHYCKFEWREPPYLCVKKSASEVLENDEFISSGESLHSIERARESAQTKAHFSCSSQDIHFFAKRISSYKDNSYPRNECNSWHLPYCRVTYVFSSTAKFRCVDGGGW